jgi:hypothetical protein
MFFTGVREGALVSWLFENDFVLPEQYFEQLRQRNDYPGERQLLLAILEDAVHCFQSNLHARNARGRRLFEEAEMWLLGEDPDALVTFGYVCDVFGFDPEYLRAGLRLWRDRQLARTRGASLAQRDAPRPQAGRRAAEPVKRAASA